MDKKELLTTDCTRISLALTSYIVLSVVFSLLFSSGAGKYGNLFSFAVYLVAMLTAIGIVRTGVSGFVPFKAPEKLNYIKVTANFFAVSFICGLISIFMTFLLGLVDIASPTKALVSFSGVGDSVVTILKYVLVPAVLEELLFRGLIITTLRKHGDGFALVVSALVFALSHSALSSLPSVFLFGLFFGALYLRSGSIIPCAILHLINNAIAVVSTYLLEHGANANFTSFVYSLYIGGVTLTIFFFIMKRNSGNSSDAGAGAGRGVLTCARPLRFFANPSSLIWLALCIYVIAVNIEVLR